MVGSTAQTLAALLLWLAASGSGHEQLSKPLGLFRFRYLNFDNVSIALTAKFSNVLRRHPSGSFVAIDVQTGDDPFDDSWQCQLHLHSHSGCNFEVAFSVFHKARYRVFTAEYSSPNRPPKFLDPVVFTSPVELLDSLSALELQPPQLIDLWTNQTAVKFTYWYRYVWEELDAIDNYRFVFTLQCIGNCLKRQPINFTHFQQEDAGGIQTFAVGNLQSGVNWTVRMRSEFLSIVSPLSEFQFATSAKLASSLKTQSDKTESVDQIVAISVTVLGFCVIVASVTFFYRRFEYLWGKNRDLSLISHQFDKAATLHTVTSIYGGAALWTGDFVTANN